MNKLINLTPKKTGFVRNKIREPKKEKEKKRQKKTILKSFLIIIAILIACVVAVLNSYLPTLITIYYSAQNSKYCLVIAQKAAEQQHLKTAKAALECTHRDSASAKEALKELKLFKNIPYINNQIQAADHLLTASIQISSSLKALIDIALDVLSPMQNQNINSLVEIQPTYKREILQNLQQAAPTIQRTKSEIELAETEISQIPSSGIAKQIQEAKNQAKEKLPQIKQLLDQAIIASRLLPGVAGYPEKQTYLFLFQNNTEIRPTGGFLGSYGILKIKDGEIVDFTTDDTYNLDRKANISVKPPWQLPTLVNPSMDSWYFRDSNWSPDFPTSAQKAEWFYQIEGGTEQFDGVIAITPTFIEYILELTGPISLPEYHYTFTTEDFTDKIQYFVEKRYAELGLPMEIRKDIIGELANELFNRILLLPKERWFDLIDTVQKAFNNKQALLYIHNKETQQFVESQNWAGEVKPFNGDYLLVIDANMASLKTDAFVDRSVDYSLFANEDRKIKARVTLTYKNNAPGFTWRTTRYRTWTRIYVPKGSELIKTEGDELKVEVYNELGKTVFGTFISIEPGNQKSLIFEYELPEEIKKLIHEEKEYHLLIQKQAGLINPPLKVNLNLPNKINSFNPKKTANLENECLIKFSTNLEIDREFEIKMK